MNLVYSTTSLSLGPYFRALTTLSSWNCFPLLSNSTLSQEYLRLVELPIVTSLVLSHKKNPIHPVKWMTLGKVLSCRNHASSLYSGVKYHQGRYYHFHILELTKQLFHTGSVHVFPYCLLLSFFFFFFSRISHKGGWTAPSLKKYHRHAIRYNAPPPPPLWVSQGAEDPA